jgi:hypothetical protein
MARAEERGEIVFHDGQNYRIMMNYYYSRIDHYAHDIVGYKENPKPPYEPPYIPVYGPWYPVYAQDDVRDYPSKQTSRIYSNGDFNDWFSMDLNK